MLTCGNNLKTRLNDFLSHSNVLLSRWNNFLLTCSNNIINSLKRVTKSFERRKEPVGNMPYEDSVAPSQSVYSCSSIWELHDMLTYELQWLTNGWCSSQIRLCECTGWFGAILSAYVKCRVRSIQLLCGTYSLGRLFASMDGLGMCHMRTMLLRYAWASAQSDLRIWSCLLSAYEVLPSMVKLYNTCIRIWSFTVHIAQ